MRVVSPAPRAEWRAVLAGDTGALPEHVPEWVDALCATGPFADASRLYTDENGRQFVLPMVRRTGAAGVGGRLMSYPPAWGMGGLVGADADVAVYQAVLADLRSLGAQRISVRPDPLRASMWSAATDSAVTTIPRRAHVLDLSGGPELVHARLSKSTRHGIRVAERRGVRVECERGGGSLDTYYALYLLSLQRWAKRQHEPVPLARWRGRRRDPLSKLQSLAEHLGKNFVVTLAYLDDQPVLGSIVLLGQVAHATRGAMDVDGVGKSRAGDLVEWTTIKLACEEGCSTYHFGESGSSASLATFKERFGAVPVDYAEYRMERLPYTRADAALRGLAKRALRFRDS